MIELIKIQKELKAPKGQKNKFGGYMYRSCEDILEAVKPLLDKHGCILTITDDIMFLGDRFYVRALASIRKAGAPKEESVVVTAFAREPDDKKGFDVSQITGAASSYARKYALNGLFLIDDTKDVDITNTDWGEGMADTGQISHVETLLTNSTLTEGMRNNAIAELQDGITFERYVKMVEYLKAHQLDPIADGTYASAKEIGRKLDSIIKDEKK